MVEKERMYVGQVDVHCSIHFFGARLALRYFGSLISR